MPSTGPVLGDASPTPYALPADALEGLLRLAAHVALTEVAIAFLRQGDQVWVLAASGASSGAAHAAALLLPDVLEDERDELLLLDVSLGSEAANVMASALLDAPGFLHLVRFPVSEPKAEGILCLAHPVARSQLSDETRMLVKEVARQITLRMEARAHKRHLDDLQDWREHAGHYLAMLGKPNSLGQCVVDSEGTMLSASHGLVNALRLRESELRGSPFERVFAFDAALQDHLPGAPAGRIPWDRLSDATCFHRGEDGELQRLSVSAVRITYPGASEAWCVTVARADDPAMPGLPLTRRSRRILVAEDHPVNQRVIQGMVEKLGLEADIVSNGLEAVHAVCQQEYAAILMDCQMPDMDGIEATRFIRANAEGIGHIPIVAVTAFGHEEDRRRCMEAGVDEFMVKPIRMEFLAEVLGRLTHADIEPTQTPSGQTSTQAEEIDSALQRLQSDLDEELVYEVVALFVDDTKARLIEISEGIRKEDREEVRNLAHKIKGSCGSLGARGLMLECEQMESLALHAPWPQIIESAEAVRQSYEAVAPKLREYLDRAKRAS